LSFLDLPLDDTAHAMQHPDLMTSMSEAANEIDEKGPLRDGLHAVVVELAKLFSRYAGARRLALPSPAVVVVQRCAAGTPRISDVARLRHIVQWHVDTPERAGKGIMTLAQTRATRH